MYHADSQTDAAAPSIFDVQCSPMHRTNIVDDEPDWRVPRQTSAMALSASKVVATRWYADSARTQEFGAETPTDWHVVKIVLRNTNIRFSVSGRIVQDGPTTPGTVHVTEPAVPVRCLFRGPYDVLHLHVPNDLIAECARDMSGHPAPVSDLARVHPVQSSGPYGYSFRRRLSSSEMLAPVRSCFSRWASFRPVSLRKTLRQVT